MSVKHSLCYTFMHLLKKLWIEFLTEQSKQYEVKYPTSRREDTGSSESRSSCTHNIIINANSKGSKRPIRTMNARHS